MTLGNFRGKKFILFLYDQSLTNHGIMRTTVLLTCFLQRKIWNELGMADLMVPEQRDSSWTWRKRDRVWLNNEQVSKSFFSTLYSIFTKKNCYTPQVTMNFKQNFKSNCLYIWGPEKIFTWGLTQLERALVPLLALSIFLVLLIHCQHSSTENI